MGIASPYKRRLNEFVAQNTRLIPRTADDQDLGMIAVLGSQAGLGDYDILVLKQYPVPAAAYGFAARAKGAAPDPISTAELP
jgi:hypothetical protein